MKRIWEITIVAIGVAFVITCLKFVLNLPMWAVLLICAICVSPFCIKWALQDIKNLNRR